MASRLGLGRPEERDDAFAWRCLLVILALYVVSFAAFYPNAATNDDESQYLRQARLMLEGRSTITQMDPHTGQGVTVLPTTYAPGLAALMAPFVEAFGWRGGYAVPMLGLVLATLLTGLLLQGERRSPIFALVVFGFLPSLVMSRVAMSDVPSAAIVALALLCFFRGIDGHIAWWLLSGFVAGASITLRFTNPMLMAPLFAGTVLRREVRCWALVVGGIAGLGVRLLAMWWYFGDAFFERAAYYYAPESVLDRLPYYLLGLLVLVPGGLVLSLAYRGRRRPEVCVSIVLFVAFYLFQLFSTSPTSVPKRVVLTLRYMVPLLPLMALACAESAPRWWRKWSESRATSPAVLNARASGVLLAAILAIGTAGTLVNPLFHWWSSTQASIRDSIEEHVPLDAVLITNYPATRKFIHVLDRKFVHVSTTRYDGTIQTRTIRELAARWPEVFLVLLDKTDSEHWKGDAVRNAEIVASLEPGGMRPELLLDRNASPTDRLRIWRVQLAGSESAGGSGSPPAAAR